MGSSLKPNQTIVFFLSGGKALFDEDFGQKVDLTVRIREILQAYADGISIVKELLQNADDAKASTVRFCWDQRQHGTQSIVDPKMAPFQGPALLIFNSGLFTEADFESIQNIGNSMKKTALNKTGRFGIGFNSVYHVTDLPSFVSGRHIVYFDPHAQFLPNINPSNPGKRIDFMANSQVLNFADQFAGFRGAFGCTLTEPFNGTIFRLPLRTAQLAATSRLSASIPDMSLLQQLFCHDSSQV
jgi:sacsin